MKTRSLPKKFRFVWLNIAMATFTACGASSSSQTKIPTLYSCTPSASSNTYSAVSAAANVLSITVDGTTCSGNTPYQNEPCAAVTVCNTINTQCATINDVLIDTGSYGLRLFNQAISSANSALYTSLLTFQEPAGTGKLAECVTFGDLSSQFGPVVAAKVQISGETAASVPIMIIDSTYSGGGVGTPCSASQSNPDTTPALAGFNGILGVGVLQYDNANYYSCLSGTCTTYSPAASLMVQNPVANFASDNNGVILALPAISSTGAASVTGALIFGIGTQTNNTSNNVAGYRADLNGEILTTFGPLPNAPVLKSFIDSGSNGLYFPSPSAYITPDCGNGFFCPPSVLTLTAQNTDKTGANANCVSFQVANTSALIATGNSAFNNLAGNSGSAINGLFDFGLPFFFGKQVFIGIYKGSASSITMGGAATAVPFFGY